MIPVLHEGQPYGGLISPMVEGSASFQAYQDALKVGLLPAHNLQQIHFADRMCSQADRRRVCYIQVDILGPGIEFIGVRCVLYLFSFEGVNVCDLGIP